MSRADALAQARRVQALYGYYACVPTADGKRWVAIQRLMYHYSLQSGPIESLEYDERFCYKDDLELLDIAEKAVEWIKTGGMNPAPDGWVKDHVRTIRRHNADPAKEYQGDFDPYMAMEPE